MALIYCVMGKSASGKDTLFSRLAADKTLGLTRIVPYTTRPMRSGEQDGETYHFTDEAGYMAMKQAGKIIEERVYETVHGPWRYFTADDGQIRIQDPAARYVIIGTLEAYRQMCDYFGTSVMKPVYVQVEDGVRLERALMREKAQEKPGYAEMCRRFLADCEDFSEEKIKDCHIVKRYDNIDLDTCYAQICADIGAD